MRALVCVVALLSVTFAPTLAGAQDKEAQIEALRKELETLKKAMGTLSERLKTLETPPAPAASPAPPATAAPATGQTFVGDVAQARPGSDPPSLMDLARPREPYRPLRAARAPGSCSSTWAWSGDFVFNLTQRNVDKANGGTFAGRENRFFPREIELSLFGQVDPYARAEVRIEAGEEFEDGEREIHARTRRGPPHPAHPALQHPGQARAACATGSGS